MRVGHPTAFWPIISALFAIHAPLALVAQAADSTNRAAAEASRVQGSRDSTRARLLESVRVTGRFDDLIGTARSASEGRVGSVELGARTRARVGELLETVPGMIVTQHSGDGKANQYFVRGFNLDHGTDFRTTVEGMPVNMPSHAHGQGYTDLNFVIPEMVDHLDFLLGVQHAEIGDFGSAGGARFHLVRSLVRPVALAEYGANRFARALLGGSAVAGPGTLLLAGEGTAYDGPWERPQGVRKYNGMARYSWTRGHSRFGVLAMGYANAWDATDQVAHRAVTSGRVSRFASLDSTTGGNAGRLSLSAEWTRAAGTSVQRASLYGIHSTLGLVSNFTYFLDDPERGDQFTQRDRRAVLGGDVSDTRMMSAFGVAHTTTAGVQARADIIDGLGLYRSVGGVRTSDVRNDRVRQSATGVYVEAESRWTPQFRSVVGLRGDLHTFAVHSDREMNSGHRTAGILNPKLSLVFTPSSRAELYAGGGFGFHSNDARGTTISVDPVNGSAAERVTPLVRSRGAETGLRVSPVSGLRSTLSLWTLELESELLFLGDGGTTDPVDGTRRSGVTFANFYRASRALSLDADIAMARARFVSREGWRAHVPGAIERTLSAGMTWAPERGLFGAVRLRHFGAYALSEENTTRARASTLVNADFGFQAIGGARVKVTLLNVLDARADDIQYLYASRLPGEAPGGVEDVHFHPSEPRQLRLSVGWRF
jgi:hypothetical protein